MPRVVVTGMGIVSPIGQTIDGFFERLVAPESGIRRVAQNIVPGDHSFVAGQIDFDPCVHWPARRAAQLDRATQFALVAAGDAIRDSALELTDEEALRAGVYWGTGLGGATTIEESYRGLYATDAARVRPSAVVMGMNNAAAANVSISFGLKGPMLNFSTACSSSASSIGEAYRAIKDGYADVIVAGGSEALLTPGNLRAWDAMRALAHADADDPSRSCKPFAVDRTGIVLGEGAAALVLESSERAMRRGARVYAEIAGYGNASDADGISKPSADGQVRAMGIALRDAGTGPDGIDYVNAHGTATQIGDIVENSAIRQVFAGHANTVAISSTKAVHGHLMGAAGAVELVASVLAIHRGVIPPTAHLDRPDPQCDLDYVPNEARRMPIRAAMSNSFGFGGMNAVIIARPFAR